MSVAITVPNAPAERAIGVFDSGVGGLSVLRALRALLPSERFVYYADSGFAPYGERGDAYVCARSCTVADLLVREHGVKALVVACNTATTAAIHLLRKQYPHLPLVGLEPGVKPAVTSTRTGHVAVLATRGTLGSGKYQQLLSAFAGSVQIRPVPCDGLVRAIEQFDDDEVQRLCAHYMRAIGPLGTDAEAVDTVVLGCTHYPLVLPMLQAHAPSSVQFIDTGVPVALQTKRLLDAAGLLRSCDLAGSVHLLSSGAPDHLDRAASRWLASGEAFGMRSVVAELPLPTPPSTPVQPG